MDELVEALEELLDMEGDAGVRGRLSRTCAPYARAGVRFLTPSWRRAERRAHA